MGAQEIAVGEGPGVFLERITGGDQEEVTLRAAGEGGALESVTKRRQIRNGRTEWEGGGRLIRW